ncbi:AlbA family DNA-binding domain-containing protein [Derxia lacustris]|uniref:AlbA family DNA-binding domain-containing protein n=1 Tax=Derxia lacustris TaxID=764842 RepID=UPI0015932442|nr:ATP-binding protein [Derxia lacustris]
MEQLIAAQSQEGPHLDFKRELPAAWDDRSKVKFMADVTAFANAGGGDIIFGMDETADAQASVIVPQTLVSADEEVRRIQDFILNLAEPRLPGTQVHAVAVTGAGTSGHAVIVRIPQSWAGPHRSKPNLHFYVRDGLRNRQLDVPEIRGLFLRSESQAQRVRDFRVDRLGKILSGEAPHRLVPGSLLVVHLVPTQAALGLVQVDPVPYSDRRNLPVLGAMSGRARLNIDGALYVRNSGPAGTHGYSQFFRNGFFESTHVLTGRNPAGKAHLGSLSYEEQLITLLGAFRAELIHLSIEPELSVMLSILGADDAQLGVEATYDFLEDHQTFFDRRALLLPDVLAQSGVVPEQALKPVFDLVWQAAGFPGSRNYNAAGEWAPRRR